MKHTYRWLKTYIAAHKIISIVVAVVIVLVGYYGYKKVFGSTVIPTYVLGQVEKGTLTSSVSASGQVSASNELNITPKVSGEVTYVGVVSGQKVKAGTVIARIDSADAEKTLRNARQNLVSAKISYQKSLQQSTTTVTNASVSVETAQTNLNNAYTDAYNAIASAFINMPAATIGLNAIYYTNNHSPYFSDQGAQAYAGQTAVNYKYQAGVVFDKAKNDFNDTFAMYKKVSIDSDAATIENLLTTTRSTVLQFQNALNGTYNAIDYINLRILSNKPTEIATDQAAVNSYLAKVNADASALTKAATTIKDAKQALADAKTSLSNTQTTINGDDSLDVQSAKLSVVSQENAVADALDQLAKYTIVAPFDGVIAKINVKVGDTTSGALATLITTDQIATVTLNEVDIEKVKIGQRVTFAFDAIPELPLTGKVAEVDTIGTVTQGVVNYGVKISFDTQNEQVKSGMSVTASIMTDSKTDALIVPSSAVKTTNGTSYVQILDGVSYTATTTQVTSKTAPRSVQVTIGISSDSEIEILSGIKEGDTIVTRTISATAAAASTARSATSLLGGRPGAAR